MSLATALDLQTRYSADELVLLADRDRDGVPDADVLALALRDASGEAISLLAGVVTIDPANVPENLVRLVCDIARYRLWSANPTEDVRLRYKDAVKDLVQIREGKAGLDGGPVNPTTPQASPKAAATEPGSRVFRRGL